MPEAKQTDLDIVATLWGGISRKWKLMGNRQQTPREESSDAVEGPADPESPIHVLNKEALKSRLKSSTASLKPKTKKTGLAEGKYRTRSAAARSSLGEEIVPISPRGKKRSRDVEAEDDGTSGSSRTRERMKSRRSSSAKMGAQAPWLLESDLPLDPRRRLRKEEGMQASELPINVQQPPHAERISSAGEQSRTKHQSNPRRSRSDRPVIRLQEPTVTVSVPRINHLRRPTTLRGVAKPAINKGGEETYDFDLSASPEQHGALPPVEAGTPKRRATKAKQAAKIRATDETHAAAEPGDAEDGGSKGVARRKRGRPGKLTQSSRVPMNPSETSPEAIRSRHQLFNQPSVVGSRTLKNAKRSRKSTPASIRASEKVAEGQERESSREAEQDDDQDTYIEGQSDDRTNTKATQAASDEDGQDGGVDPALLGEHVAWSEIVGAARKNRVGDDEGSAESNPHGLARHVTKTLQNLSKKIKEASRIYVGLIKGKSDEETELEANDKLSSTLDEIEFQIKEIKEYDVGKDGEQKARSGREETIQDIYKRGVPDMIYLLKTAMVCRSSVPPEIYSYTGIQEIVRLQNMTARLCSTAVNWSVKPPTSDKPIIRNVRSIIFPFLRDKIRKAFAKELRRLWIVKRKQENREKMLTQVAQSLEFPQEPEAEAGRQIEGLRRMEEDIRHVQEGFRAKLLGFSSPAAERRSVSLQSRYPSHQPEYHDALWTLDEERELMIELQKRRSRNLPGKSRRSGLLMP